MQPLLVRTPAPKPNESLFGFLLRLCEVNGYDSPRRILEVAGVHRGFAQTPLPGLPGTPVARVLNRAPEELHPILLRQPEGDGGRYVVQGHDLGASLRVRMLSFRSPSFCPRCVAESGFISAFWDLAPAVACPKHGVAGPRRCGACGSPVKWFRRGLVICHCGHTLADGDPPTVSENTLALMRILEAKLNRVPLSTLTDATRFHIEWFESTSMQSILRVIAVLADEVVALNPSTRDDDVVKVGTVADALAGWPNGYHALLRRIGERSITASPGTVGLRKQFRTLYDRMFRNNRLRKEVLPLREEFLRFAVEEWGEASVDQKLFHDQTPSSRRFVSRAEFARKHKILASTLDRMISDGDIVAITKKVGKIERTIIDLQASKVPVQDLRAPDRIDVRDVAKEVGLPVSVIQRLKRRAVMPIRLRAGKGSSWFRDDVQEFMQRTLALAETAAKSPNTVTVEALMRLKFRSATAKADIVEAALDGRLTVLGRVGPTVGGLQLDRLAVDQFVLAKRIDVEGKTYSYPQAARMCGIDAATVPSALRQGLLAAVEVNGRSRITHASLELFNEKYVALAGVARDLKASPRALRRLCESEDIPLLKLARPGGGPDQPLICAERVAEVVLEHHSRRPKSRAEVAEVQTGQLRAYLRELAETGGSLPRIGGKLNKVEIARQCAFPRDVLYDNTEVMELLRIHEAHEAENGVVDVSPRVKLERYLQSLAADGAQVPLRNGQPNKLQIATACGFDRDVFRRDPGLLTDVELFANNCRTSKSKAS